jgi:hypothetical protein
MEYVTAPIGERSRVLDEVVRPRFTELAGIATATGSDWAVRYRLPDLNENSFRSY